MAIPNLNSAGDLPAGVHPGSLAEVQGRFGASNAQRIAIYSRLERIYQIAVQTGHLARFVVFGSFVTDEPHPNDVDVFMVLDESFNASETDSETQLLLDHAAADVHFGASVFWLRRPAAFGGEQATIEFWQTKRDGRLRGIVEITGTANDQQ